MCKDKKIVAINDSDLQKKIPPLISEGWFKLLTANRSVNYRKELIEFLNQFYPAQPLNYNTWKNRYNSPSAYIPERDFDTVIKIMEEGLAYALYKMLEEKELLVKEDMELIENLKKALNTYNDEQDLQK